MTQTRLRPRDRILDAAAQLYGTQQSPVTVVAIAKAAGVARASVYREFTDPRALQRALTRERALPDTAITRRAVRPRILAGARRAVCDHGLFNASVERIANAAGVGAATVYRHFEGKDAVLRAAFDELPSRQVILRLLDDLARPPRPTLTAIAEAILGFAAVEPEILRLVAFSQGPERTYMRALRAGQQSAVARLVRYIAEQQRRRRLRPCPPLELVGALLGALYACSVRLSAARGGRPSHRDWSAHVRAAAEQVVNMILSGAGMPEATGPRPARTR